MICNQPAKIPPIANPAFVGIKIDPAEAGDQPLTAIAYAGVKNKTDHLAAMIPSCARQERSAPRDLSTVTGMIGSEAKRVSIKMNARRMRNDIAIGIQRTVAEERPKRNKHIAQVCVFHQQLGRKGV